MDNQDLLLLDYVLYICNVNDDNNHNYFFSSNGYSEILIKKLIDIGFKLEFECNQICKISI